MENINVEKLPRKELIQLCTDHKIRTAGVKQDELIRLLQKKLQSPVSTPPRMPKARSQIASAESPPSSPKPKTHSRTSSTESLPTSPHPRVRSHLGVDPQTPPRDQRGKIAEKSLSARSTDPGRSDRSLLDNHSRRDSSEQTRRELSSDSGLPRKPISSKTASAPAQKSPSDLLRKKASTSSGIGKLAQDRHSKPVDGSSRSRNVSFSEIGKQPQERRPRQVDGSSLRTRNNIEGTRQSTRGSSMAGKRPGERSAGLSKISEARKPRTNADTCSEAATSPRASEAGDCASVIDNSDLCSVYSFCSVSEVATDAGQHYAEEDYDVDDVRSVSSEPASRLILRAHRLSLHTSTLGSKMDHSVCSSWETAHGRDFLDSSVKSSALNREGLKLTELAEDREDEFSYNPKDMVSSARDATTPDPSLGSLEKNSVEMDRTKRQKEELEKLCKSESTTTCSKENEIAVSEGTKSAHLHSNFTRKDEAALAAGHSASESGGNLSTKREISPPPKVEPTTHTSEAAIEASLSVSKQSDDSSKGRDLSPASRIAEVTQTREATTMKSFSASKLGVDSFMELDMSPVPRIAESIDALETAITVGLSASESEDDSSMNREISPAPVIAEIIQTSEAAIVASLSKSGGGLSMKFEMSPPPRIETNTHTNETVIEANLSASESGEGLSTELEISLAPRIAEITHKSETVVTADLSASESGDNWCKEREMSPSPGKAAVVQTSEAALPQMANNIDLISHSEVSDIQVSILDHQQRKSTEEDFIALHFDKTSDEFNSGHPKIEQAVGCTSTKERNTAPGVDVDALIGDHGNGDKGTVSLGIPEQHAEMTHPAASVRSEMTISKTLPDVVEKAQIFADCHIFDPGHRTGEEVIGDSNIFQSNSNTVLASCPPTSHFERKDATTSPLGVHQQEIEMAACEVQHRNTDSFQVDFRFTGEKNLEGGNSIDCTSNLQKNSSFDVKEKGICKAGEKENVGHDDKEERSIPSQIQEEAPDSDVPRRENEPPTTDRLGKDDSNTSAVSSVGKRSFTEYEPLLQPDILDTTSIAPVYVNLPESRIKPNFFDSKIGYDPPEPQIMSFTTRSPGNEREDSDTKMRDGPCASDCGQLPDFNKDGRELKVNLLQDKHENVYQRLDIIQGHWCLAFFKAKILKTILISGRT